MATTFNLSPTEKQGVIDFIVGNLNNPEVIRKAAQQYGATADDLASVTGIPVDQVHQYFLNAGVPMGTLLTGGVQRTIGTEGNIRQLDKGEDITVEKAIGRQGNKIVVQRYDAYGTPTTTRLADPNTSEGKGWLQALGIVGGAIGLSSLPEISSLFGGAEAATAAGGAEAATATGGATTGGIAAGTEAAAAGGATGGAAGGAATGATAGGGLLSGSAAPAVVGTEAAATGGGLLSGGGAASSLAVAGVEGAASQAATTAYANALAATGNASIAAIAADVASSNVAAGLTVADSVAAAGAVAADAAATGAATAGGTVAGSGGSITTGVTTTAAAAGGAAGKTLLDKIADGTATLKDFAGLAKAGIDYTLINNQIDKLREQGKVSKQQYDALSTNLFNAYRDVGQGAGQALGNIAERASNMVGQFTPYGVSTNLVNTQVNPQTGQLESNISPVAQMLMAPLGRAAIQSAQAAEMTDVDQLSRDYYNKLAALSAPGIEQQRLATEARMRAQGRLGLLSSTIDPATGRPITTSAPELLAQEQAIARQQLERELQSRQAALGERGTLLSQSQQAFAPLQQVSQQALQQAQLSGQLGQLAQAGRTAQAQAYLQPAMASITQPLSLFAQGLPQVARFQGLGIAEQQEAEKNALAALSGAQRNASNSLFNWIL